MSVFLFSGIREHSVVPNRVGNDDLNCSSVWRSPGDRGYYLLPPKPDCRGKPTGEARAADLYRKAGLPLIKVTVIAFQK